MCGCCVTSCNVAAPNAVLTAVTSVGSFDFAYAWRAGVTGFTRQGWIELTPATPIATCESSELTVRLSMVTFDSYATPPLGQQSVEVSLASTMTTGTVDVTSVAADGTLSGVLDVPDWQVHAAFAAPLCVELYAIDK